jgi:hypothetical protein
MLVDVFVGDLFEFLLGTIQFVGRDLAVLLGGLEVLAGIAPDVADGDAPVLGHVLDHLDVLAPALFGERREVEPDDDPSLFGDTPRSLSRMARSMAPSVLASCGLISSWRASGTWMAASCCSGTGVP